MALLSEVKNFFLPDADTSRARRIKTFGTESKAVVGAVIVGTAAAAIAAPAIIGSAGGGRAIASSVGKAVLANPGKATVAALGGTVIAGRIADKPTRVTQAPVAVGTFASNVFKASKNPSSENIKNVFKESPVIATGAAIIAAGTLGSGLIAAGSAAANLAASKKTVIQGPAREIIFSNPSPNAGLPENSMVTSGSPAPNEPITPATQVIGRPASTGSKRQKRKKTGTSSNVSIRLLNQNTYIQGAR